MKAKAYLSQVIWLDQLIDNKIEQQERLRAIAEKVTTNISIETVSGSSRTDSRENIMVKLIDLSHEINDDIDELIYYSLSQGKIIFLLFLFIKGMSR